MAKQYEITQDGVLVNGKIFNKGDVLPNGFGGAHGSALLHFKQAKLVEVDTKAKAEAKAEADAKAKKSK